MKGVYLSFYFCRFVMEKNNEKKTSEGKKILILLILLFLLFPVLCYSFYYVGYKKAATNLDKSSLEQKDLIVADNLSDAGDLPVNGTDSEVSEEQIDIPGYSKLTVDENESIIPLMNLDTNSVYFVYTIFEGDKKLLETEAIPPNKQLNVDFYELLEGKKGIHKLLFVIDTFDVESKRQCNGASQDVSITVE